MAGPYDFLPLDTPATRGAFGDAPDLAATQPINFADAGDPPALLLHGDADETVRPFHSARLAARLEAAGVPVTLHSYAGIGHIRIMTALSRWTRGSAASLEDITGFVRGL
jgi:dipeptidyl aminopeptidase/acylaminoacyl peptidase